MRGNLKDDIGDKLGAIEDYARAIKIDTSYDTAYYNRGLMKSAIGDREGELADYNKTLSINPKYLKKLISIEVCSNMKWVITKEKLQITG